MVGGNALEKKRTINWGIYRGGGVPPNYPLYGGTLLLFPLELDMVDWQKFTNRKVLLKTKRGPTPQIREIFVQDIKPSKNFIRIHAERDSFDFPRPDEIVPTKRGCVFIYLQETRLTKSSNRKGYDRHAAEDIKIELEIKV